MFEDSLSEVQLSPIVLSEWARLKIGTFQSRLEAVLQAREGKGYRAHGQGHVSSALLMRLVNESFGFNGWSSSVLEVETLSHEEDTEKRTDSDTEQKAHSETEQRKYSAKTRALVKISLRDGTSIEAQGLGECVEPHKYLSLSNSLKKAVTNGLRNAILQLTDLLETGASINHIHKLPP